MHIFNIKTIGLKNYLSDYNYVKLRGHSWNELLKGELIIV